MAGILNQDDVLKEMGVVFLCENARDVEYEVKKALQKTGLFAVVMTPRAIYQGNAQGVTQAWTLEDLQLQIVENPPVHRAWMKKRGHTKGTGLDVARQASERLAGPQGGHYGQFTTKTMEEAEREGLVVTTVSFGATVFEDYLSAFPSCDVSGSWSLVPFVRMSDLSDWLEEYLSCEWNRLSGYMPLDMSGDMNIRMSGHKLSIGGDPAVPGDITPLVVDDMYGMVVTWQLSSSNGIFGPYIMMKPAAGQTGLKLWNSYALEGGGLLGDVLQGLSDQISGQGASLSDYYKKTETSSAEEIAYAIEHVSVDLTPYYKKTETSSAEEISAAVDGLSAAVEDAIGGIDFSDFYTKSQTSSRTQLQEAFDSLHECGTVLLSGEYDSGDPFEISVCVREKPDDQRPLELYSLTSADISASLSARTNAGTAPTLVLEWSNDGLTWTPYEYGTQMTGRRIMVQAVLSNATCGVFLAGNAFRLSGECGVRGNPISLLDKTLQLSSCPECAFIDLFLQNPSLIDASKMVLPFTQLNNYCYRSMFEGCTGLVRAPKVLPAPAATGYQSMFGGCRSLSAAPVIKATSAGQCGSMFSGCVSLKDCPEIPVRNLEVQCYNSMFSGCTGLTSFPDHFDEAPWDGLSYMFSGCTGMKKPPKLNSLTADPYCYRGMFSGCTGLTAAPELPAKTVPNDAYQGMFRNCSSLSTAPKLPATTLGSYAYNEMFRGCTSLTAAPELPANQLSNHCYYGMFRECRQLLDAPVLSAKTLYPSCYREMFYACSRLTGAPELPATALAEACYQGMFRECSSLAQGPSLPAGDPAKSCYSQMFRDCDGMRDAPFIGLSSFDAQWCCESMFEGTSVSSVTVQITAWNGDATDNWLRDVPQTGEFYCPAELGTQETMERGEDRVPQGWRVYNDHEPLRFVPDEDTTLSVVKGEGQSYECSEDGGTWSELGATRFIAGGTSLYVRAAGENETCRGTRFEILGPVHLSGSVQSLLKREGWRKDAPEYCFAGMFQGISGLARADVFGDIMNAGDYCCMNALSGCAGLTATPSLGVRSIGTGSFQNWLAGCSGLTAAVQIPDATWGEDCFAGVMRGTKIEQAGVPNQSPPRGSLDFAFSGCDMLNKVSVDFGKWGEFSQNWLEGVAAEGVFTCPYDLGTPDTIERGPSRCPYGWRVNSIVFRYTPVTIVKHDSTDAKRVYAAYRYVGSGPNTTFALEVDDGSGWRDMEKDVWYTSDDRIKIRAKSSNTRTGYNDNNYTWIDCGYGVEDAADVDVYGNLITLLDKNGELSSLTQDSALNSLFQNNEKIVDVSHSTLSPVLVDAGYAARRLFASRGAGFGALDGRPQRISAVPEIDGVSADMRQSYADIAWYQNCPGISSATYRMPWPVYTGSNSSYSVIGGNMFQGCSSLTSLVLKTHFGDGRPCPNDQKSRVYMLNDFARDCTALNRVSTDLKAWPDRGFPDWLNNVSAQGVFICPKELDTSTRDVSHIPVGWTIVEAGRQLRLEADGKTSTVKFARYNGPNPVLEYTFDEGATWTRYTLGQTLTVARGDAVGFRAAQDNLFPFAQSPANYCKFEMTGAFKASGKLDALISQIPVAEISARQFMWLFDECSALTDASELELPASHAEQAYYGMFHYCGGLTAAPEIPAGTPAAGEYRYMFADCTDLLQAPNLPSKTVSEQCYNGMFRGCASLTAAPELPATVLTEGCYDGMFYNCAQIANAPVLPAQTPVKNAYRSMFKGCAALSSIDIGLTSWAGEDGECATDWVRGVAAEGMFKCSDELGTEETIERGFSRCPQNWGVENPPPVEFLPWVYTNSSTLRTGVPASPTLSVEACLSGNSSGGSFIGNGPEDSSDWRFFNTGGTFYADVGSARESGGGWYRSGWNTVSVWNLGWKIVNANGVYN